MMLKFKKKYTYCSLAFQNFIKSFIILFFLIFVLSPLSQGFAQSNFFDNNTIRKDSIGDSLQKNKIEQKDLRDVIKKTFKLKSFLGSDTTNQKGEGPFLSVLPAVGYALSSGVTGALVSNISFYTDTLKKKLSSFLASAYYSQYNQYWAIVNSNIFYEKHKMNFVGDWRYYKFPTNTFGLGSKNSLSDAVPIDYSYIRIYQLAMKEIAPNFFTGIGYHLDYHYNIKLDSNQNKTIISEINNYNIKSKNSSFATSASSGLSLNLQYDNRSNSVNPEKGIFAIIQYRENFKFLGSNKNWKSLLIDFRKYFHFPNNSNNVLSFWSYNYFTLKGNPPYLDLSNTGGDAYSNSGRGYVQGRFRGKNMIYLETEYRFEISRNGLFGGVVFANTESLSEYPSNKIETFLPGAGVGLRLKMNKQSKANIAIDYGFGLNGSHGLFFNIGEVF